MADFTSSPEAGFLSQDEDHAAAHAPLSNRLTTLTNVAGALVSLALVAGVGVWGYKLLVRDVSGIPVVRAAQGDMRVRPEDPGGDFAQHQGLSVNAVAAEGSAAKPADELRLAPEPVDLTEEDRIELAAMVAETTQDGPGKPISSEEVAAALESGNVEDLVAKLTDGVAPIGASETERDAAETSAEAAVEAAVAKVLQDEQSAQAIDAPGVRYSLRPKRRPAGAARLMKASLATGPAAAPVTGAAGGAEAAVSEEVDPTTLPAGTRLAQLGAFDSAEVARGQWDQLQTRFSAYLGDKKRVVQKASSGGRTFYRLRAMGFEDIADARRFCSALVAENADCIPVVTR